MKRPAPCSEETGSVMPEYCAAGMMVRRAVANSAAIWLLKKEEITSPIAVEAIT